VYLKGPSVVHHSLQHIYTEDIQDVITLDYHLYADDTQLIAKSVDVTCRRLESCVASVQRWCASRRLQLNADKTELIWFGSAVNLERLQTDPVGLTIAGVNVKAVDCVGYVTSAFTLTAGWTCERTSVASYRHATFIYDGCAIYATWSARRPDSVLFRH